MSSADWTNVPSFPSSGQPPGHHWTSYSMTSIHGYRSLLSIPPNVLKPGRKGKRLMVRILLHSSLKTYLLLSAASVIFLLWVGGMRIVHKCWFWILKFSPSFLDSFHGDGGGRRWKSMWQMTFSNMQTFLIFWASDPSILLVSGCQPWHDPPVP